MKFALCTPDEAPICHNMASSEKEVGHRNHALQQLEQGAEGLSKEEMMALRSLLNSYVDVFALVNGEFGKSNKIKHRINTQGAEPVKHAAQKAMAIPQKRRGAVCMLSDMLKRGVIEEYIVHGPHQLLLCRRRMVQASFVWTSDELMLSQRKMHSHSLISMIH